MSTQKGESRRQVLGARIPYDLHTRLKSYTRRTGVSINHFAEEAIRKLLDEREASSPEVVDLPQEVRTVVKHLATLLREGQTEEGE